MLVHSHEWCSIDVNALTSSQRRNAALMESRQPIYDSLKKLEDRDKVCFVFVLEALIDIFGHLDLLNRVFERVHLVQTS